MNPAPLIVTWAVAGVVGAAIATRTHRLRLAAMLPMAAALAALFCLGGGADPSPLLARGGLSLGSPAAGVALVGAIGVALAWLIAPPVDAGEILAACGAGALAVLALSAGSPLLWGVAVLGAAVLAGVVRVSAAPARASLSGLRVTALGAAALVASSPFLPVDAGLTGPRLHLVGGLLSTGVAALLLLLPFGGWFTGTGRSARAATLLPYVLLLLPAVILPAQTLQLALPSGSRVVVGWVMLPLGSLTAAWSALVGLVSGDRDRYPRVLAADLGLVALGLTAQSDGARLGSMLLLLTHLAIAPLLLAEPAAELSRPRRLAWLALSGIPPSPASWGRLALATALADAYGAPPLLVTLPTMGLVITVCLRAFASDRRAQPGATGVTRAGRLAAWLVSAAALGFGLAPVATLRTLLGIG